ncbi:MAG TPA: 50S ribosomal protein L17, partial [Nitrospiria bacterium]|nr:50S ribosomal protein L17 [Nitrospiria bacterium]
RHKKAGRQLGRNTGHRRALFRSLVTSLLDIERIETTEAKAKEISSIAEKMITLGKRDDLHARRQALAYIRTKEVVAKLFDDVAKRFNGRNGGYTRIIKTRNRLGDGAPMAMVELVVMKQEEIKEEKKIKKEKAAEA